MLIPELAVPTPIQPVRLKSFSDRGIDLYVKRDDLIHPRIIGNKLRKSMGHLQRCIELQSASLLTFGGRYSNHLLAIAQAGQETGIPVYGVVRGTDLRGGSLVLDECQRCGMSMIELDAAEYRSLQSCTAEEIASRLQLDAIPYVVSEGGTSPLSLEGTAAIINEIPDLQSWDTIVTAVGTGGTAAGLVWGLAQRPESRLPNVLALAVLKGYTLLPQQGMSALIENVGIKSAANMLAQHLEFDGSAPFGRYGKPSAPVLARLQELQDTVGFPVDYVYTGKALLHLEQKVLTGQLISGSRVLFLHTGGYQTAVIKS